MNNITFETASFSEQLGVYDFFNVLVSGATFILGLCVLNSKIKDFLWVNTSVLKGLSIAISIYLIGVILQELASIWDEEQAGIYIRMSRSILKGNAEDEGSEGKEHRIIENPLLLRQYQHYADDLLRELNGSDKEKESSCFEDKNVSAFMFSICQYYVAVSGKDKKVEKMRALYNMSNTMMMGFVILAILAILSLFNPIDVSVDICRLWGVNVEEYSCCINKMIIAIAYLVIGVLLRTRTEKIMKRFLLILLGTYDAIIRIEKKNT